MEIRMSKADLALELVGIRNRLMDWQRMHNIYALSANALLEPPSEGVAMINYEADMLALNATIRWLREEQDDVD